MEEHRKGGTQSTVQSKATCGEVLFFVLCQHCLVGCLLAQFLLFRLMTEPPDSEKGRPKKERYYTVRTRIHWELTARLLAIVLDLQNIDVQDEAHGYLFILMFSYSVSTAPLFLFY